MTYVEYVERIDADARAVWRFIDWPNMELMCSGGFFTQVEFQESRPLVGATRRLILSGGSSIVERLEAYDDQAYHLAYRILDSGDMPVADYQGEVRISACGESACFLKFSSNCSPVGLTEAEWSDTYRNMQSAFANFIKQQITAGNQGEAAGN